VSQSWPTIVLPGRWPAVLFCLRFDLSVSYVDKSLGFSRVRTECNFSLVLCFSAFVSSVFLLLFCDFQLCNFRFVEKLRKTVIDYKLSVWLSFGCYDKEHTELG
jgi:hypothetical protein